MLWKKRTKRETGETITSDTSDETTGNKAEPLDDDVLKGVVGGNDPVFSGYSPGPDWSNDD